MSTNSPSVLSKTPPNNANSKNFVPRKKKAKLLNRDLCNRCKHGGTLLCCDFCPLSFHEDCSKELLMDLNQKYPTISIKKQLNQLEQTNSGGKKRANSEIEWHCPKCIESSHVPLPTRAKDARLFSLVTSEEKRLALGARVTLGRVMQHLELTVSSDIIFMRAVTLATTLVVQMKLEECRMVPLQMISFMKQLSEVVGEDKFTTALKCAEEGGWIAYGLETMGGDQDCPNPKCVAHKKFRVLRMYCLYCGTQVLDGKSRLPKNRLQDFQFDHSLLSSLKSKHEGYEKERMKVALRGLEYFDQVANEPKMLEAGLGDIIFLSYKLWGALRGTSLENRSRIVCEKLCNYFVGMNSVLFAEEAELPEILDTAEGRFSLTLPSDRQVEN
jgi:hypothetical protein